MLFNCFYDAQTMYASTILTAQTRRLRQVKGEVTIQALQLRPGSFSGFTMWTASRTSHNGSTKRSFQGGSEDNMWDSVLPFHGEDGNPGSYSKCFAHQAIPLAGPVLLKSSMCVCVFECSHVSTGMKVRRHLCTWITPLFV